MSGINGSSRWFFAFEKTAKFALRKAISASSAMSESRPEKMISQSGKSDGMQRRTIMSAKFLGRGTEYFQRATSEYRFPLDLAEAPSATSSRWGCWDSSRIKRVPTAPVAPRTPNER